MQSEMSRRPGRLKPPEIPTSLDPSASHRDEVRVVLDMLDDIIATTKDVVREEGRGTGSPTLARVTELSTRVSKDIMPVLFAASTTPPFKVCLETYKLILVDVRNRLVANYVAIDDVTTINRRLDLFIHEFEEKMDLLVPERNKPLPSESANMFPYAHHFNIFGGIFNVVSDTDQSHKILRILYIQCGVLFA